ncbi:hypothetical protein [Bacillus pseudomycoides]|uniref:hypothetical protein n=1 Tax=Bacillus pseudomycoides TaxID=64104 RepID=UPI000BF2AE0D|nr:hypothetical protein [Bacillus pseudomycoides]PGE00013.1 hypothetical protein COM50_07000 [Bacillus pseudomycoides]
MKKIQKTVLDEITVEKNVSEQEIDAITKALPSIRNKQIRRLMEIRVEILQKDIESYKKMLETGGFQ